MEYAFFKKLEQDFSPKIADYFDYYVTTTQFKKHGFKVFLEMSQAFEHNRPFNFESVNYFFTKALQDQNITRNISSFSLDSIYGWLLKNSAGDYKKITCFNNPSIPDNNQQYLMRTGANYLKKQIEPHKTLSINEMVQKNLALTKEFLANHMIDKHEAFITVIHSLFNHKEFIKNNPDYLSNKNEAFNTDGVNQFFTILNYFEPLDEKNLFSLGELIKSGFLSGRFIHDKGFPLFPQKKELLDIFINNQAPIFLVTTIFFKLAQNLQSDKTKKEEFINTYKTYLYQNIEDFKNISINELTHFGGGQNDRNILNRFYSHGEQEIRKIINDIFLVVIQSKTFATAYSYVIDDVIKNFSNHLNFYGTKEEVTMNFKNIIDHWNANPLKNNKNTELFINQFISLALHGIGTTEYGKIAETFPFNLFFNHKEFIVHANIYIAQEMRQHSFKQITNAEEIKHIDGELATNIKYLIDRKLISPSVFSDFLNDKNNKKINFLKDEWVEYSKTELKNLFTKTDFFVDFVKNYYDSLEKTITLTYIKNLTKKLNLEPSQLLKDKILNFFSPFYLYSPPKNMSELFNQKIFPLNYTIEETEALMSVLNQRMSTIEYKPFSNACAILNDLLPHLKFSTKKIGITKLVNHAIKCHLLFKEATPDYKPSQSQALKLIETLCANKLISNYCDHKLLLKIKDDLINPKNMAYFDKILMKKTLPENQTTKKKFKKSML